jgi:hypothetical protein
VSRIWADGVDCDKHTITSLALEPQNEQRGGPEIDSVHSGRDRPRLGEFPCPKTLLRTAAVRK